jgi:RTX calcium-binding nonapeptide repeat (4 copies)
MNIDRNTHARRLRPAVLAGAVAAAALGAALAAPGGAGAALGYSHHFQARYAHLHRADTPQPPTIVNGVLSITGTREDDRIALRLQAGAPNLLQVDFGNDGVPEFTVDRTGVTSITVDAGGGGDSVSVDESNGPFENVPTTIDGGSGDDRIAGGSGNETLIGGPGDDTIDGNRGADTAFMGGGDDTFIWDPGDGSDVVEGQGGHDRMLFNGAPASEQVDISANGDRLRFFRNPVNITMDTHGVEQVDFVALGGADVVTVNDLRGTGVREVNVDLGPADLQADRVVVNATDRRDRVKVSGDADAVEVKGLPAKVTVLHPEAADSVEIDGIADRDRVESRLPAGIVQLLVNGVPLP